MKNKVCVVLLITLILVEKMRKQRPKSKDLGGRKGRDQNVSV